MAFGPGSPMVSMAGGNGSPGPIAERAFDTGFKVAVAAGVGGIGLLYWTGVLSLSSAFHAAVTLALFPVYLLAVAVLLAVWLGFSTDGTDLERVTVEVESDES